MTMRMRLFQSLRFALECFGVALVLAGIWRWAGLPREIWAVWLVAVLSMLGAFALTWLGDRVARRELMELIEAVCADAEAVPENVGSCTGASGMPRATGAETGVPARDCHVANAPRNDIVGECEREGVPARDAEVSVPYMGAERDEGACTHLIRRCATPSPQGEGFEGAHAGAALLRSDDGGACEDGRVMCEYEGYVLERSVDDENTVYITMPDGLRLVFREDEYVGWYVCGDALETQAQEVGRGARQELDKK